MVTLGVKDGVQFNEVESRECIAASNSDGKRVAVPEIGPEWLFWLVQVRQLDNRFKQGKIVEFKNDSGRIDFLVQYDENAQMEWHEGVVDNFKLLEPCDRQDINSNRHRSSLQRFVAFNCLLDDVKLPTPLTDLKRPDRHGKLHVDVKNVTLDGRKRKAKLQSKAFFFKKRLLASDKLKLCSKLLFDTEHSTLEAIETTPTARPLDSHVYDMLRNNILKCAGNRESISDLAISVLSIETLLLYSEGALFSRMPNASVDSTIREGTPVSDLDNFLTSVIISLSDAAKDATRLCRRSFAKLHMKNEAIVDPELKHFGENDAGSDQDFDEEHFSINKDEKDGHGDMLEPRSGATLKCRISACRMRLHTYISNLQIRLFNKWTCPSFEVFELVCLNVVKSGLSVVFAQKGDRNSNGARFGAYLSCCQMALFYMSEFLTKHAEACAAKRMPFLLVEEIESKNRQYNTGELCRRIVYYQLFYIRIISTFVCMSNQQRTQIKPTSSDPEKNFWSVDVCHDLIASMRNTVESFQNLSRALALGVGSHAVSYGACSKKDVEAIDLLTSAIAFGPSISASICRRLNLPQGAYAVAQACDSLKETCKQLESAVHVPPSCETVKSPLSGIILSQDFKHSDVQLRKQLIEWSQKSLESKIPYLAKYDQNRWVDIVELCAATSYLGCVSSSFACETVSHISGCSKQFSLRGRAVGASVDSLFDSTPKQRQSGKSEQQESINLQEEDIQKIGLVHVSEVCETSRKSISFNAVSRLLLVGRASYCELSFSKLQADSHVMNISRQHALLKVIEGESSLRVRIVCLSSLGILVNGNRLDRGDEADLNIGDRINFHPRCLSDRFTYQIWCAKNYASN